MVMAGILRAIDALATFVSVMIMGRGAGRTWGGASIFKSLGREDQWVNFQRL